MNRKKVYEHVYEKVHKALEEAYADMMPGDDSTPIEQAEYELDFPSIEKDVLGDILDECEDY